MAAGRSAPGHGGAAMAGPNAEPPAPLGPPGRDGEDGAGDGDGDGDGFGEEGEEEEGGGSLSRAHCRC